MDVYIVGVLVSITIFGLLAVSLDLLLGWAGLFSIAHAATFGAGAYASALAAQTLGLGFWGGLAAAILVGAAVSALVAIPSLRVSGDYLVLASFGVQEVLHGLYLNLDDVTGGPGGLRRIPRPEFFGMTVTDPAHYLALYAFLVAIVLLLLRHLMRAPLGLLLRAIREDEVVPQALGKNVVALKVTVFVLSGALAGMGGSLYAHYFTFISPESFDVHVSIFILSMVLIGGMGTLWGGLAGAALLIALPEVLRFAPFPSGTIGPARQIVYGLILIAFCFFRPTGLVARR
jgi:branched-chain amino acid transport system permease protein